MKVAPNKGSKKSMLKNNSCHGYLITLQSAKKWKKSVKTYVAM